MTDCLQQPFVDNGVTGLKFTKPSRYLFILFQEVPVSELRDCRYSIFLYSFAKLYLAMGKPPWYETFTSCQDISVALEVDSCYKTG